MASQGQGDLTAKLTGASVWDDETLENAGIPIVHRPFTTIGGGLGSFAMVNTLRIAGVATSEIRVLTNLDSPSETYKFLARSSQIPDHERLRSDAASTMDNIWGFPSYAVREAFSKKRLGPLWNVFSEPVLADFYTPQGKHVYDSLDNEAERIGWRDMIIKGQVRTVRRRLNGGYFSLITPPLGSTPTKRVAVRSEHVHIAVGYPRLRFVEDLERFRSWAADESPQHLNRVVNAYEPHDFVYNELMGTESTVIVRGSGIVASRILQRLLDDCEKNGARTKVVHLFRTYVSEDQNFGRNMVRRGYDGFAYQGFNFPKAAWGGQLKDRLESLDGPGRAKLIGQMGGTNTPKRSDWQRQLARTKKSGTYNQVVGTVRRIDVTGPRDICVTFLDSQRQIESEITANFIIDATGLDAEITENRVLNDLLKYGGAKKSAYGRLDVSPSFEVLGTRSGEGRLYASGASTLGGYYAGVDSFLGLQYAALTIADDLASMGFAPRIGTLRSVNQWWRWMRKKPVGDRSGR